MIRAIVVFLLLGLVPATAHHAPSGWAYPTECCGGKDCSPLEAGDLRFMLMADGTPAWKVLLTDEIIPVAETHVSPDQMNHRCVYLDGDNEGMTRKQTRNDKTIWCLWVSGGNF